ncbi:MAG TPA: hypothetical protein VNM66_02390 [Thermodesulfobacteriota bacterium]|nr:hypothetical protein [Thermodesulfobacteriota bacterium]
MRLVITAYLVAVAFLAGMLNERVLHGAQRDAVVKRYERALADWKAMQIRMEQEARAALLTPRRADEPSLAAARSQ